ncbi:MAG: FxLYD domain-containing protein [Candidatus Acidiferrales bacterium]
MEPASDADRKSGSGFPAAFAVGAVVVLLLFGGLLLLTRSTQPHKIAAAAKLPFGAEERNYAANLPLQDVEFSQSSNLLNQEFTYATGKISNDGSRAVRALELTLEFHDQFNQVILRETQRAVDLTGAPLPPGQQRDFQITIEQHIPSTWNQQYPSIRVTGLVLQ